MGGRPGPHLAAAASLCPGRSQAAFLCPGCASTVDPRLDTPPPSPVWWGHRKQYRDGLSLSSPDTTQTWRDKTVGTQPHPGSGSFRTTRSRGSGGWSFHIVGCPTPPLFYTQGCHLGPSYSPTLAPLPSPETWRQGRWGLHVSRLSVCPPCWLEHSPGQAPLPKPLLCQAAGSELSGLAASKVVFVSSKDLPSGGRQGETE